MTDQEKDLRMRVSMLMDSELDGRDNPRLVEKLEQDIELKAAWSSYHLIGDVLRANQGQLASRDFSSKVSAMIADEPTILAPNHFKKVFVGRPSVISLGLAASLAVVALVVGKSFNDNSGSLLQAVNSQSSTTTSVAMNDKNQSQKLAENRFNDYLVMHNETAYMAGSAGMLPYVRLVQSGNER